MFDYCEKNCYSTNIMYVIHHQEYQKTYEDIFKHRTICSIIDTNHKL